MGQGKKKIRTQIFFSVRRAFHGSGLYCSVCARDQEGCPWTLCPWWVFGGRWRHTPSPGVSQIPSSGVCGSAVAQQSWGGSQGALPGGGRVSITRSAHQASSSVPEVCVTCCHHHLSAATVILSCVQCACRGSSQEPNFSVPFICEFSFIIFMIFLRALLVFY